MSAEDDAANAQNEVFECLDRIKALDAEVERLRGEKRAAEAEAGKLRESILEYLRDSNLWPREKLRRAARKAGK